MVSFTKAAPKQSRLKLGFYGPTGSGKTFTALLVAERLAVGEGKRVAYVDTERGTDFYARTVPERPVHPEAFEFDALYTRSLADVTEAVSQVDPATHGVVVVDSISHLWDAAQEAFTGRRTSADTIPLHAWSAIKRPYRALINTLMGAPYHAIICGRQKNVFGEGEDGELRKVGVDMRAEAETPYEPHITIRMELRRGRGGAKADYLAIVEKDRTGVLAGKTVVNPTGALLDPVLPLLGAEQAQLEDEDERQAKDAELLERDRDRAAAKTTKSAGLLADFQARVAGATTVAALGEVGERIKAQRRYMTEDHLRALRTLYEQRRDRLVDQQAPEV